MACLENSACYGLHTTSDCNDQYVSNNNWLCYHVMGTSSHNHTNLQCTDPFGSRGNDEGGPYKGLEGISIENNQEIVLHAYNLEKGDGGLHGDAGRGLFVNYVEGAAPTNIQIQPGHIRRVVNVHDDDPQVELTWRFIFEELTATNDGFSMKLQSQIGGEKGFLRRRDEDGLVVADVDQKGATVFRVIVTHGIGLRLRAQPTDTAVYASQIANDVYVLSADGKQDESEELLVYIEKLAPGR